MDYTNKRPDKWRKYADELRKFKGFENISEKDADKVIEFLVQLAELEYKMMQKKILEKYTKPGIIFSCQLVSFKCGTET